MPAGIKSTAAALAQCGVRVPTARQIKELAKADLTLTLNPTSGPNSRGILYPALASSIVRANQAQLGPLHGRGFETARVQNTLLPNPSEGSAPSLRAAASESASCRRLGVIQAVASVPRAARPWPCATPYLT